MVNLKAVVLIVFAIASLMIGSSSDLIEQGVKAQNKSRNNDTNETSMNESGSISGLQTPIRPPFA
jgi:hypothetical protein